MIQLDISVKDIVFYFTTAFAISILLVVIEETVRQTAMEAAREGVREEVMKLDMVLRQMENHYGRRAAASTAS